MSRARSKKARRLRESSGPSTAPPPAKVSRRHRKKQWAFTMRDGGSKDTSHLHASAAYQQDRVTVTGALKSDCEDASDDERLSAALSTYAGDEVADDEPEEVEYDRVTYRVETHGKSLFNKARHLSYIRARCGMKAVVHDVVDIFREQVMAKAKEEGVEWREKLGL